MQTGCFSRIYSDACIRMKLNIIPILKICLLNWIIPVIRN